MKTFMEEVSKKVPLAVVGGSDLCKIVEQLGSNLEDLFSTYEYIFSENGLVGYHRNQQLPVESISTKLGEEKLQEVINFCLHHISTIQLPLKRGTFVEYRKGMLNVSPIGRSCSQAERDNFVLYDAEHQIRAKFVEKLRERFADYDLTFSIGGQISIDIFPKGWDKTYCLKYLQPHYDNIYFFGDKTAPGGNDHEIYEHMATVGTSVINPDNTRELVAELVNKLGA
jgi:phosphomannomutase